MVIDHYLEFKEKFPIISIIVEQWAGRAEGAGPSGLDPFAVGDGLPRPGCMGEQQAQLATSPRLGDRTLKEIS